MAWLQAIAAASASARPRVLIVDDSAVARAVLTRMVEDGAGCTVADAVPDIAGALRFLAAGRVDVILLDLEMPGVHGLAGLPDIIAAGAGAKVLVVSSAAEEGAAATIEALALGAADTLVKPGRCVSAGSFAAALAEKLVRLGERMEPSLRTAAYPAAHHDIDVVAIGASTGGIHAINSLLLALPRTFRKPIVITQHLPPSFIPYFAEQVAIATGRRCQVAADAMVLRDDVILVAPGDAHVTAVRAPGGGAAIRLSHAPVENGNMPSVDPMFETFAECFGARMMAVVLSGMGRDGFAGARLVRSAGGTVVVQDQASSVVWGMPGAVAAAGLASAVLSPEAIGGYIAGEHGGVA